MDQIKIGSLIRKLRSDLGLTQKQLADRICVSDKAVSKWERGCGCPDISLLTALADVFGTDVQVLLNGELKKNESEIGNMKNIKFFVCKNCGNIITAASDASVSCCGQKLSPLVPRKAQENEMLSVQDTGGELFVSSDHPMTKENFISFAAYVSGNCFMLFRQYPEWNMQFSLPPFRMGRLVWYSSDQGLLYQEL